MPLRSSSPTHPVPDVDAHRFSIAWSRIQPTGSGPINAEGLDFYDRAVDALLEAGVAPFATLYHWDLPSALQTKGGWMARETAERYGHYPAVVGARLADRVAMWMPVNEPVVVTLLGHAVGAHAPGESWAPPTITRPFTLPVILTRMSLLPRCTTRSTTAPSRSRSSSASTPMAWVRACPDRSPRT